MKNVLNLVKILNKTEQRLINGGTCKIFCHSDEQCCPELEQLQFQEFVCRNNACIAI